MKLLAPAGNFESLKSAVYYGADEVYLGINQFNARNNIDGFNLSGLSEAVTFAHAYGVKVLVAVNILFDDDEIQSALDLVVDCFNLGVDAFIVQDMGLISLLYKNYPEIPIHASTQMGIHNLEGVKEIEKLGIKRVVLARETPISEIKRIKDNSNIEIEYFVHGALCVSFSGNCYMSSYLHNASGNRGKCKQLCRLPYTLKKDGKQIKSGYLLSAKDFNLINRLDELKKAGVDVLKIEGRARRKEYVGMVVNEYRKALDGLKFDKFNLDLAFNRGFTNGYFDGNGKIISNVQNHVGIEIGRVLSVNNGKKFNEIVISSNYDLSQKSTIKIFNGDTEKNTISLYDIKKIGQDKYLFTTTQKVDVGNVVRLILDSEKENQVSSYVRKINKKIYISFKVGCPAFISDGTTSVYGEVLDVAKSSPLTKEEVISNFNKSDFFIPDIEFVDFENVFIPKSKLNELRRIFYDNVLDEISTKFKRDLDKIKVSSTGIKNYINYFDNVEIYSPEEYILSDINNFTFACKNQGKLPFLDLPNFATEKDILVLKDIVKNTGIGVVINNLYALSFDADKIIGGGLNVYNKFSANFFDKPFITAEIEMGYRKDFPLMTLRHCPIKSHIGGSCANCKYQDGLTYVGQDGKSYKLSRKKVDTCTFYLK